MSPFEITFQKKEWLTPLLTVAGAVDKKQALPILSNILLKLNGQKAILTATDLEIEISATLPCESPSHSGMVTLSSKKFVDIIRSLDDTAKPRLTCRETSVTIREGRSQFKIAALPADNYPASQDEQSEFELDLPRDALLDLLQTTHFAMSQQDVRFFLNGLFFEISPSQLVTVGSDGHRMAVRRLLFETNHQEKKLLLPRRGVLEMLRLLTNIQDDTVSISAGKNHFRLVSTQYTFVSKLVETRFPPYAKAIPKNQDKQVLVDRDILKRALSRIMISAHEKSRAIVMHIQPNQLTLIAHNQEHEEAQESLEVSTIGDELKIGVNAGYLLDVLNVLGPGELKLSMSQSDSSLLINGCQNEEHFQYVIMPMKM